jgi:hypothetical protein
MSTADQTGVNSSYGVAWRYPIPRHRLGGLKTGCPSSCLVWLARCWQHSGRSAKDQIFSTVLHGEASLAAKSPELEPLIREVAQGRDDIRVEFAHHSRVGGSPIPLDGVSFWSQRPVGAGVGERRRGAMVPYGPTG